MTTAEPIHIPALLEEEAGIPRSEVRRLISKGLVMVNRTQLSAAQLDVPAYNVVGREIQVQRENGKVIRFHVKPKEQVEGGI
jgi:16S rRNA U516 pseudouridylate synthase RsuA-like enzyme